MAMSKKHFEALARILSTETKVAASYYDCGAPWHEYARARLDQCNVFKHAIADFCATQNPNFDRERFLDACEPK